MDKAIAQATETVSDFARDSKYLIRKCNYPDAKGMSAQPLTKLNANTVQSSKRSASPPSLVSSSWVSLVSSLNLYTFLLTTLFLAKRNKPWLDRKKIRDTSLKH